jgi:hypothetical protein
VSWTPQIEKVARELWLLNQSAGTVAQTLNARFNTRFTRNSVIGKAWRRGWSVDRNDDAPQFGGAQNDVWTADKVAVLRRLIDADVPYVQIAEALGAGFSAGSVSGKVKRLGWSSPRGSMEHGVKQARNAAAARRAQAWRVENRPSRAPAEPKRPPMLIPSPGDARALADLKRGQCRWPLDLSVTVEADATTLFCGAHAHDHEEAERPYCPYHTKRASSAGMGRKPATVKDLVRGLRRFA